MGRVRSAFGCRLRTGRSPKRKAFGRSVGGWVGVEREKGGAWRGRRKRSRDTSRHESMKEEKGNSLLIMGG